MSYDELVKLREEWEKGYMLLATIPQLIDGYATIYVLLEREERYYVNRYFKIGDKWQVSVDKQDVSLDDIMEHIHMEFETIYNIAVEKFVEPVEKNKSEDTKT